MEELEKTVALQMQTLQVARIISQNDIYSREVETLGKRTIEQARANRDDNIVLLAEANEFMVLQVAGQNREAISINPQSFLSFHKDSPPEHLEIN